MGRFSDCLIKKYDNGEAQCYRLYNNWNKKEEYKEYSLKMGETGELAYTLSHSSERLDSEWGQELGVDADPRICYGHTPTSDTFVTCLVSYSAEHPDGITEYMNAGMGLEAAPGYYKVHIYGLMLREVVSLLGANAILGLLFSLNYRNRVRSPPHE